jgi:hypothetical protein
LKLSFEGLDLDSRDGLVSVIGAGEVLVRGNEVLILPVGGEYAPAQAPGQDNASDSAASDEEEKQEDPVDPPAEKKPEPASEPKPEKPTGGGNPVKTKAKAGPRDHRAETLAAIQLLVKPSAGTLAKHLEVSVEACLQRLYKLRKDNLVEPSDDRPKRWSLTDEARKLIGGGVWA